MNLLDTPSVEIHVASDALSRILTQIPAVAGEKEKSFAFQCRMRFNWVPEACPARWSEQF